MAEFNSNDWQGRRKDQVEYNEKFGIIAFVAFVIAVLGSIAYKILA